MRTLIFALCLLLCGVGSAGGDTLRWYDCKAEVNHLRLLPTNATSLLEKVLDPRRVSACARVKIRERVMMIAAIEPLKGARAFQGASLTSELQVVAGGRYAVFEEQIHSLSTSVYRGMVSHPLKRRPTFVPGISVGKEGVPHRLALTFYGDAIGDEDIENAFKLVLVH